jgi:hypothetical protein
MDDVEFWDLIKQSDGDEERLRTLLHARPREDLQAFDRIYRGHLARAYRWDLWGAGYVINGGMSDDGFDYFCDWLIGRGRAVFEAALADPDSLADVPAVQPDEIEAEGLRYAVQEAYEEAYDEEMPAGADPVPDEPAGEEWAEEDLQRLYPRLAARWG